MGHFLARLVEYSILIILVLLFLNVELLSLRVLAIPEGLYFEFSSIYSFILYPNLPCILGEIIMSYSVLQVLKFLHFFLFIFIFYFKFFTSGQL